LSVLDEMAARDVVWTQSIQGLEWAEVDYPMDLMRASAMVNSWDTDPAALYSAATPRIA
jgi:choline kinase